MRRLVWLAVVAACSGNSSSPQPAPAPVASPTPTLDAAAPDSAPVAAPPADPAPTATDHTISARLGHACARTRDGRVSCWGRYKGSDPALRPTVLPGLDSVAGIAVDTTDACAWRSDGRALCVRLPAGKPELIGLYQVDELAADSRVVCARHAGRVSCWTRDAASSMLGALTEAPGITDAIQIAVADDTACALRATGEVACWSHKPTHGGSRPAFGRTPKSIDRAKGARAITGGGIRFAALLADGTSYGWDVFAKPWTPPAGAARITLGDNTTCAEAAGAIRCATGAGGRDIPALTSAIELSVEDDLGCARMPDGHVRCWGYIDGLGIGEPLLQPHPVEVTGIDDAVAIAGNNAQATCVLRKTGRVSCWGMRLTGKIAHGQPAYDLTPVDIGLDHVTAVEMGSVAACAHTADQKLWCWGDHDANKRWDTPTVVAKHPAAVPHGAVARWVDGSQSLNWVCVRRGPGVSCTSHGDDHDDRAYSGRAHDRDYDSLTDVAQLILPSGGNDMSLVLHGSGEVEMLYDDKWHPVMDGIAELVHVAPDKLGNAVECALKRTGVVSCWQGAETAATTDLGITDGIALVGSHEDLLGRACVLRKTGHVVCWGEREKLGDGHSSIIGPTDVPGLTL